VIKRGNDHDIVLTKEEFDLVAGGTIPAGLSGKLTPTDMKALLGYVRRSAKKEKSRTRNPLANAETALKLGPRAVMYKILNANNVATLSDPTTDHEELYIYNTTTGIYERGEEKIKEMATQIYISEWSKAFRDVTAQISDSRTASEIVKRCLRIREGLEKLLTDGPKGDKFDEVLKQIRVETYTSADQFNPPTHIPFKNGLLNVSTWELQMHNPTTIYTWRIEANLQHDRINSINLNDAPLFRDFLRKTFESKDIPLILQYGGYSLFPDFPRQMILWIVGRPRIGKGTFSRVLWGLNPHGACAVAFEKLIMAENRFAFQNIRNKNLLIDPEVRRKLRRGETLDFGNINRLFGGDPLDVEKKGKTPETYISKAKGLFIANLPLPKFDNEPFLARVLLVKTQDRNITNSERIANLDSILLEKEADQIATLFVRYLKILSKNNWNFLNEKSTDEVMAQWELFSDAVIFYIEDAIVEDETSQLKVEDVYASFVEWSRKKGIPTMARQSFVAAFGKHFRKKNAGPRGRRYYVFTGCDFTGTVFEVEHAKPFSKTLENTDFQEHDGVCSTSVPILELEKEKEKVNREYVQKLDTGELRSGEPKNKAPCDNKSVINLQQEFPNDDTSQHSIVNGKPRDSGVQSEKYPMTEKEGKLFVEQLLGLGYHIDPDTGPNIDRKYFKIGVVGMRSLSADQRGKLEHILDQEHFKLFNSGGLGIFWYVRPLARDTGGKPQ